MTFAFWRTAATICAVLATPSVVQASADRVAAHNDWAVFMAGNPTECYIVSQPTGSTARRGGQPVEVNRGDIRMFVRFNPAEGVKNEVSFRSGYPLKQGEPVRVTIGSSSFSFTPVEGDANEWAWPQPQDDAPIVAAMRRGSTATVTGVSARDTTTVDTFSLAGFTAAVNEADSRCQ